jgi:LysR family cyn operon transcriptional activator
MPFARDTKSKSGNVELRHLKYFMRAAELSHFTRAAESLYISQPSLSVHIQQLEDELKTKLFTRAGRHVHLTESGRILLEHARHALEEIEEAGREIDATTGLLQGTLTIATISLFGSKILPAWVDAFSSSHPNVQIKVRVGRSEDIESGLLAGTFDLGFSLTPCEHPELNVKELVKDHLVVVFSKDHPLAKKTKLEIEDLSTVRMALASNRLSSSRPIGAYLESIGVTPNTVIEEDDGHALLALVKRGNFVTFMLELAVQDEPDLRYLCLPGPGILTGIGAMWTQLNAASSAFLDITKIIKGNP